MRIFKFVFHRFNIPDCKTISLPVEKTSSEVMVLLDKKIENYEYSLGETIFPQTFTKTFVKDGNYSHLLVTVNVLYDTARFLSDNEYYLKHKEKINVQASIEEPKIYILARCPSTNQLLFYSDERIGDIMNLKYPTKSANNEEVNDVLRFFKADSPARQFEGGQQKGKKIFCVVCPLHANHVKNIASSNIKKSFQ